MDRKFIVYEITGPEGKKYIGYTSMRLSERWRHHRKRASDGGAVEHPFYQAIRKFGAGSFHIMELETTDTREKAMQLEMKYIAAVSPEQSYNLTRGGFFDSQDANRLFWERINKDPVRREEYIRKLSQIKKAHDWTDYGDLVRKAAEWRKENPKEAYRLSYRAVRIANRKNGRPSPSDVKQDNQSLKERLRHKYCCHEIKSEIAKNNWASYNPEKRQRIAQKISKQRQEKCAVMSLEEKQKMTVKARASIDREKQSLASSEGLKRWWSKLKSDPEKYHEYMSRRSESLSRCLERKKLKEKENEDV